VLSFGVNDTVLEGGRPRGALDRSASNLADLLTGVSREGRPTGHRRRPVADEPHNDRISAPTETFARICAARRTHHIDVFPALRADPRWRDQVRTGDRPSADGYASYAEESSSAAKNSATLEPERNDHPSPLRRLSPRNPVLPHPAAESSLPVAGSSLPVEAETSREPQRVRGKPLETHRATPCPFRPQWTFIRAAHPRRRRRDDRLPVKVAGKRNALG
jgi:hypothetical protein